MKRGPAPGRWQLTFDWTGSRTPTATPNSKEPMSVATAEPERKPSAVYAVAETAPPLPGEFRELRERNRRVQSREGRRVSTTLPVPKPLAESVAAGHFGYDEAGQPVHPTPQEVREITENHALKLMQVLIDRYRATGDGRDKLNGTFEKGIADYVEDFGPYAGERLRAHAHKLAAESLPSPPRRR